MAQSITEVMTRDPVTVKPDASIAEAAKLMRDRDVGALVVTKNGTVDGIVTDRDITVRAVADGKDPQSATVADVETTSTATLSPDQSVDEAIALIREQNVRRVPVVEDGRVVGIVSIGDLAIERDADSALADISSEPPNN
jgi:CBS domain-containing protein